MSEEERKLIEQNIVLEDTLLEITPELMKKTIVKQDKEIERLNKEADTYMKIATKRYNIIKEVREVVEEKCKEEIGGFSWYIKNILDKENKE